MARTEHKVTITGGNAFVMLALSIVFAVLKLTGKLAISWLWVFAPLWIPMTLVFGTLIVFAVLAVIARVLSGETRL